MAYWSHEVQGVPCRKSPGKRGHIVADTLLSMMFLGLRKLGSICCGHKMFLNKIRNIFCVRIKLRGQTGKHLCRQQCVRNNVSSFARALSEFEMISLDILTDIVVSIPNANLQIILNKLDLNV